MSGIGLIFLCTAPLAWIVSPDTVGKVSAYVIALIGIAILALGSI